MAARAEAGRSKDSLLDKEDFTTWLESRNVSSATIGILKGQNCIPNLLLEVFDGNTDNEVYRKEFQLLTDDDLAEIIKPIGTRRKLINLRDKLNDVSP